MRVIGSWSSLGLLRISGGMEKIPALYDEGRGLVKGGTFFRYVRGL